MTDRGDGHREEQSGDAEPADAPADGPEAPTAKRQSTRRHAQGQRTRRAVALGEPVPENLAQQDNGESPRQIVGREHDPVPIEEYTTDRRSLTSIVQVQWAISTAMTAVLLGLIVTAVLAGFTDVPPQLGALSILVFLGLGLLWVLLRYRVWVYQIREDAIYLERGVVTHVRTLVPYVRIQHVDTSRGPVERALGLSTLVVYTAGSRGADVSIPGLQPREASDLQQRIKELAIEAEGDDAL